MTPRMGKDTLGRPGQAPGLSTFTFLELAVAPGDKAQVIDLDLLHWRGSVPFAERTRSRMLRQAVDGYAWNRNEGRR